MGHRGGLPRTALDLDDLDGETVLAAVPAREERSRPKVTDACPDDLLGAADSQLGPHLLPKKQAAARRVDVVDAGQDRRRLSGPERGVIEEKRLLGEDGEGGGGGRDGEVGESLQIGRGEAE